MFLRRSEAELGVQTLFSFPQIFVSKGILKVRCILEHLLVEEYHVSILSRIS